MAIFRGTGGSVGGITDADILLISISQGGTGATTASGARTNLGLGTAATTDASAYATAAQGAKADTALQSFTETDPVFTASEAASITSTDTTNWDTAYTDRLKWDGGSTGLNASTARTSLGLATVASSGDYNDLSNKPTIPTNLDSLTDVVITSPTTNQTLQYNGTNWVNATGGGGSGTVTSVDMTVPTGLAVSGNPVTTSGTLAVTYASGYSIPTTTKQTEWDTAYTDRLKWDGGSTGLTASTGRTSLGATTLGSNLFTITNPSAVTFPRFNADNTVSSLSASDFRTAIGAGTGSGTVTSVAATVPSFLSVSGSPITSSGTLAITYSGTALPVANGGTGITSFGTGVATWLGTPSSANLAAAITDETGSGALVFGTSPTLVTPTINSAQVATVSGTAPLYMCRAWVNFNGTGTVAIRASGNVSSITDNGTGDYTVNFTTALADADYAIAGIADTTSIVNRSVAIWSGTNQTSSLVRIGTLATGGSAFDANYIELSVFR